MGVWARVSRKDDRSFSQGKISFLELVRLTQGHVQMARDRSDGQGPKSSSGTCRPPGPHHRSTAVAAHSLCVMASTVSCAFLAPRPQEGVGPPVRMRSHLCTRCLVASGPGQPSFELQHNLLRSPERRET